MLKILSHPAFAKLFAAQIVALAGTGLLTIALGLLAFELAGPAAGAVLGTAYAIKMVAYVGIAPLVGAYASRLPASCWSAWTCCWRPWSARCHSSPRSGRSMC